jgi:hypothetical protein
MKPELVAVAVMILTLAAGVLLLWPRADQPLRQPVVEALAGPQPASAPPARGAPR